MEENNRQFKMCNHLYVRKGLVLINIIHLNVHNKVNNKTKKVCEVIQENNYGLTLIEIFQEFICINDLHSMFEKFPT